MTAIPERADQIRVASYIGLVVGFLFAVFNMLTPGMFALGATELVAVLFFVAPAAVLCRSAHTMDLAENLLLLATFTIFGALIIFGGIGGTGMFWVFTVPFLAFFVKAQRTAWVFSLGFLLLAVLYLFGVAPHWGSAYPYTTVQATHFLLALAFYTGLAAAFNHIRTRYAQQLQKAKERAEEDVVNKSRFLAAASHDLRQPSHALGLFVARLTQVPQSDESRELVQGVEDSVRALQRMLDEFFDYSRLGLPTMEVKPMDFAIEHVLAPVRDSFASQALAKGIGFTVPTSTAWVHADPALVQRVLINLVANAVQYTTHGRVLVACRPVAQGRSLRLQVWDTGMGIAPELQDKVFSEFYQVANPERDRAKGFGLGLSIVRLACQRAGYPLELHSRTGRGSCFSVTLPMVPAPVRSVHTTPVSPAPAETGESYNSLLSRKVLLLEDDPLGGAAEQHLLQGWGCTVEKVANAEAALQCVRQGFTPNLLISDYRLPGGHDGMEAIAMVRAEVGPIPACLVSGDTDPSVRARAATLGIPLLQKPVRPAKLRAAMRHLLQAAAESAKAS
ncbi:MAG: hybrid sensor histidine kinase/response regulator [Rhodoferax sp.]|nr:MAG: hybrid sensor histidine kinase/response regulator [Rhodoferax sp.]